MVNKKDRIATALKYNPEEQIAPKVIAKGAGYVADAILKKGEESDIPVYKDEKLSQQLYNLSIGEEIPEELYELVAEVLIFIARLDSNRGKGNA
jgi:FlhB-like protein